MNMFEAGVVCTERSILVITPAQHLVYPYMVCIQDGIGVGIGNNNNMQISLCRLYVHI